MKLIFFNGLETAMELSSIYEMRNFEGTRITEKD